MHLRIVKLGIPNTQVVLAVLFVIIALISFFVVKDTPEEAGTTPDGLEGLELQTIQKHVRRAYMKQDLK